MTKLGGFDVVIGNPPWGAEAESAKAWLERDYALAKGQYDSYELFLEKSYHALRDHGALAFVIPDSILKPEHEPTRRFIQANTAIGEVVKVGEGVFEDVFRAAVAITFSKERPGVSHELTGAIIFKEDRDRIMRGDPERGLDAVVAETGVRIKQTRFVTNPNAEWDIWVSDEDLAIRDKLERSQVDWKKLVASGRGIELTKFGSVLQCPYCLRWNSIPRKIKRVGLSGGTPPAYRAKKCASCGKSFEVAEATQQSNIVFDEPKPGRVPFYAGEDVNRYFLKTPKYIDISKPGIRYKEGSLYQGPKILMRKTGIGTYATIDSSDAYATQSVLVFRLGNDRPSEYHDYSLEYILAVLNSRLMLYYTYKQSGDVEWKSFPYQTQKTVMRLPLHAIDWKSPRERELHDRITTCVQNILGSAPPVPEALDYELESLVLDLYEVDDVLKKRVWQVLGQVQRLRIIRELFQGEEGVTPTTKPTGHGSADASN
jgi:hypothetical protein